MMRDLDAFEDFNPLVDELPERLQVSAVAYVIQQAKAMLKPEITLNDLNGGLEILIQLRKWGDYLSKEHWKAQDNIDHEQAFLHTGTLKLFLTEEHFESALSEAGSSLRKHDLMLVQSLGCAADYVTYHTVGLTVSEGFDFETRQHIEKRINAIDEGAGHYLADALLPEAVEALGFARQMSQWVYQSNSEKKRRESISKKKLANYFLLKFEIVTEFNKLEKDISNRNAARIIEPLLSDEAKFLNANKDLNSQITTWIRQYKNGSLAGIEDLPIYVP